MASREIPNLATLVGSRHRAGPRAPGRAGGASAAPSGDDAVRATDQDAAASRASCVALGYLDDPYASLLAPQQSARRLPLLNRGTYVRTSAIDRLVDRFLASFAPSTAQLVSLGAGTDTRYFRLRDRFPDAHIIYHEVDFPANTAAKLRSIQGHARLHSKIAGFTLGPAQASYHSPTYNVHALDLRSLATASSETPPPDLPNLDPCAPTLILSEMCLIYLHPSTVSSILDAFLAHYLNPSTPAALILYEPILPHDAFGRTMVSNLAARNIKLPTLTAYPELPDQRARLKQYGFVHGAKAADTHFIWREWVSDEEKERVAGLEMLDELEELELLLRHYCVAWGWRDGQGDNGFSKAWEHVKEQDQS